MKTTIKFTLALLMVGSFAMAQVGISTRNGVGPAEYRAGTRPAAKTWGLTALTGDILFEGGTRTEDIIRPAITLKYYNSDQTTIRIGFYFSSDKEKLEGETGVGSTINSFESKYKLSKSYLYPALEYHLNNTNLVDVYAVISGRVGYENENRYSVVDVEASPLEEMEASTFAFGYGIGAGIGLQFFVADLPLAIGAEVGVFANGLTGIKTRVQGTSGGSSYDYYTIDPNDFDQVSVPAAGSDFEDMKARTFDMGTGVRFSLTYFFNR